MEQNMIKIIRFGQIKTGLSNLFNLSHLNTFVKKVKMRLTKYETEVIKNTAYRIWGNEVIIYLFGSRADDSKKGGDIDLFIQIPYDVDPDTLMLNKARFLTIIDMELGEQKIDLLLKTTSDKYSSIFKTAETTGVKL